MGRGAGQGNTLLHWMKIALIYEKCSNPLSFSQIFFFFNPSPNPFPFADVYSSLILQLGPGQLTDPVFLICFFFFQSEIFMYFLNYI